VMYYQDGNSKNHSKQELLCVDGKLLF
jgi:hypothetical protein